MAAVAPAGEGGGGGGEAGRDDGPERGDRPGVEEEEEEEEDDDDDEEPAADTPAATQLRKIIKRLKVAGAVERLEQLGVPTTVPHHRKMGVGELTEALNIGRAELAAILAALAGKAQKETSVLEERPMKRKELIATLLHHELGDTLPAYMLNPPPVQYCAPPPVFAEYAPPEFVIELPQEMADLPAQIAELKDAVIDTGKKADEAASCSRKAETAALATQAEVKAAREALKKERRDEYKADHEASTISRAAEKRWDREAKLTYPDAAAGSSTVPVDAVLFVEPEGEDGPPVEEPERDEPKSGEASPLQEPKTPETSTAEMELFDVGAGEGEERVEAEPLVEPKAPETSTAVEEPTLFDVLKETGLDADAEEDEVQWPLVDLEEEDQPVPLRPVKTEPVEVDPDEVEPAEMAPVVPEQESGGTVHFIDIDRMGPSPLKRRRADDVAGPSVPTTPIPSWLVNSLGSGGACFTINCQQAGQTVVRLECLVRAPDRMDQEGAEAFISSTCHTIHAARPSAFGPASWTPFEGLYSGSATFLVGFEDHRSAIALANQLYKIPESPQGQWTATVL